MSRLVLQITIPTPQGYLEGILRPEQEGLQPQYIGIVCHLHPRHGGSMLLPAWGTVLLNARNCSPQIGNVFLSS
jgi:alpha/beta superfamily hydrolase